MDVLKRLAQSGVVPVVVLEDAKDAVPTAKAMLAGGIDVMEITFRTAAAADSIKAVAQECPDMVVGAGTVVNLEQCKLAVECGAKFIVSPGYDEETVAWCCDNGIPVTPGCVTPTEIMMALKHGLKVLKFFPANVYGGLKAMKNLSAPFVGMKFLPDTGYVPEFAKVEKKPFDKNKAAIACITMAAVLVVIALNPKKMPMHVAAVIGSLVIMGTKCMTVREAIAAIDWNCMLLVGSLTAISTGVQKSGAGAAMAELILQILGEHPSTFMITTVIFIAAVILTQVMSNIPTIMLFMPIGVSIAKAINVSPYPICMIITLAGAASYATPFAAPQNMMTVGWTQYRFMDYIKAGLPMLLVTYLVIVAVIPFYLPY